MAAPETPARTPAPEGMALSRDDWQAEHHDMLARATPEHRVLLEAAVRLLHVTNGHPIMRRIAAFFLLHAGMGIGTGEAAAAVGRTDRAMRTVQSLTGRDRPGSIWGELGRHRQPKLQAEHAGPIAKHLIDHPGRTQDEMVGFISRELGIQIDPLTLRRFFKKYGLGVLRARSPQDELTAPFDSGGPASAGHCSASRRRSP